MTCGLLSLSSPKGTLNRCTSLSRPCHLARDTRKRLPTWTSSKVITSPGNAITPSIHSGSSAGSHTSSLRTRPRPSILVHLITSQLSNTWSIWDQSRITTAMASQGSTRSISTCSISSLRFTVVDLPSSRIILSGSLSALQCQCVRTTRYMKERKASHRRVIDERFKIYINSSNISQILW